MIISLIERALIALIMIFDLKYLIRQPIFLIFYTYLKSLFIISDLKNIHN